MAGCGTAEKKEYQKKLDSWNDYNSRASTLFSKYKKQIKTLDELYLHSLVFYDYIKAQETASSIIEIYNDYLKEIDSINPPDFSEDLHGYQVESIKLELQKWQGILNDYKLYIEPDKELEAQILEIIEKVESEREKIDNFFTQQG